MTATFNDTSWNKQSDNLERWYYSLTDREKEALGKERKKKNKQNHGEEKWRD